MIGTRAAVALSLLLSVVAVAVGAAAFMSTVRDERVKPGRLVQTRITNQYEGAPVAFPIDDFFLSRGDDGRMRALYAYPPGFFGHTRGCRVIWDPEGRTTTAAGEQGPGLFVEPCGGARFDRDGRLLSGPADRGLDYFTTEPGVEGIIVDSRTLYCGPAYVEPPAATSTVTATATPTLFGVPPAAPVTPTSTATPTRTAVDTRTPAPTPSAPERCERVTSTSRR